ncbi:hypothetical protein [Rhizobium sullae]|nr:hypothetical protein [Rhizobium sullae]
MSRTIAPGAIGGIRDRSAADIFSHAMSCGCVRALLQGSHSRAKDFR